MNGIHRRRLTACLTIQLEVDAMTRWMTRAPMLVAAVTMLVATAVVIRFAAFDDGSAALEAVKTAHGAFCLAGWL
jgi:hypothetical protein